MGRLISTETVEECLFQYGFTAEKLGNHSIRKGAATYCSAGSTCTPSQASIDIRGGWSQGAVKDVYQRFQSTGDQYVGRTVSGLPRHSDEFAILPPRFAVPVSAFVKDAISLCFSYASVNMIPVMHYALASVVHHSDYLIENLPAGHLIFSNALFRTRGLLEQLKREVIHGFRLPEDSIQETGIPPDVQILQNIRRVPGEVDRLLEERTILGQQITPAYFREALDQQYERIRTLHQPSQNSSQSETDDYEASPTNYPIYNWGNKPRLLPEHYKIPKVGIRSVFNHWYLGIDGRIPPLKLCKGSDLDRSEGRRLSDLKKLMNKVEVGLESEGLYIENPSPVQVVQMYENGLKYLEINHLTSNGRVRRFGELIWTTIARKL